MFLPSEQRLFKSGTVYDDSRYGLNKRTTIFDGVTGFGTILRIVCVLQHKVENDCS